MLTLTTTASTFRIAIFRTSSLGDVVLATSCLSMLAALPIQVAVTWIGRSASLDMIKRSWPEVRCLEVPKSSALTTLHELLEELQHINFIVDLQCNLRSRWLCRNLKLTKGIPFIEAPKAQLFRNRLLVEARLRGRRRPLSEKALEPAFYQYRLMAQALLLGLRHELPSETLDYIKDSDFPPHLPIPDSFDPPWRKELRFGKWLAVAPGAAHPTKQAPLSLMIAIIAQMVTSLDKTDPDPKTPLADFSLSHEQRFISGTAPFGLVFLGDSKDRDLARSLIDTLGWNGPMLNLAGKLSLWESAGALSEASALLANDSSLGHIAEAVGTPVATLFGPTIESFGFAPRLPQSRAFSTPLGCRPCSKHGMVSCRYGDQLCFATINPNVVADHLAKILAAKSTAEPRGRGWGHKPLRELSSPEDLV